jgi:DNA-binding transcriptional ArsR family regulator
MTGLPEWVKLPNAWIEKGGLRKFRWDRGLGADNVAALMTLSVIAHHMRAEDGVAEVTYDDLSAMASLSRAKVSNGLAILETRALIERRPEGRSTYRVCGYSPAEGWAMFPAKGLYRNGVVSAFSDFRLRQSAELEALKLFFLIASRRSRQTNTANITYEKIEELSGIATQHVKRGLTILGANGLVHVERMPSALSEHGVYNAYRLAHIYPRQHRGTMGRANGGRSDFLDME